MDTSSSHSSSPLGGGGLAVVLTDLTLVVLLLLVKSLDRAKERGVKTFPPTFVPIAVLGFVAVFPRSGPAKNI